MECKFPGVATKSPYDVVLIETLWNVNGDGEGAEKAMKRVLIETLWNVNYRGCPTGTSGHCFNRNIVECKWGLTWTQMAAAHMF